ncbi:hypothetical protein AB6A40_007310 [Gnathostoma spinigerum]|uniref:LIM interaction domain-containing protein n=1 Tax=Gnathostoma spinigerum TaxID=75299 RepID=A0ABD6ELE8_9BILA
MPRRKANENGTASTSSSNAKPRARRSKKDAIVASLEPKLEMVPAMFDAQSSAIPQVPMMHTNGMMTLHDDGGPMSSHHVYTPPTGSIGGAPPPDYYQPMPAYQSTPMHGATNQQSHQFIEPEPPQSPYVAQQHHLQPHNHIMMRYRHIPAMGPPNHHQGSNSPSQLEFRLHEMNRRLYIFSNSGIQDKDHAQWWDAFAHEFFDDDAKMSFVIFDDQNPVHHHRYTIGRMLIPRYFRSIFESGVKEMFYVIRTPAREQTAGPWTMFLDCDNVLLVSKHDKPVLSEVHTECKLMCEFVFDETYGYRVRQWNIELRHCQEFVLRDVNMFQLQDSEMQEKLKVSITRTGMTQITLNYLRLSVILEPMQVLMSQSKSHNIPPRESLKQTLFQAHAKMQQYQQQQQMAMSAMGTMNPPHVMQQPPIEEPTSKKPRKRTRKTTAAGAAPNAASKKKNNSSPAPNAPSFPMNHFPLPYQDVMVVGEPSMMGGEYGEEDERTISRVENTQFDPNAMQTNLTSISQQIPSSLAPLGAQAPPS